MCADGEGSQAVCCPACFGQGFVQPDFPEARAEIEAELLRQPGYRYNAPFRNWEPGWSLAHLRERTEKAQAQKDAGSDYVRAASIGTPRTWAMGEILTASNFNTFLRDIQRDIIGINGPIELLDGVRPGARTQAEIQSASDVPDGALYYDTTTDQIVYRVGAATLSVRFAMHDSGLLSVDGITDDRQTITHTLGRVPQFYQIIVERLASEESGWMPGDQFQPSVPQSSSTNHLIGVLDASATQYTLNWTGSTLGIPSKTTPTNNISAILANDPQNTASNRRWAARILAFG